MVLAVLLALLAAPAAAEAPSDGGSPPEGAPAAPSDPAPRADVAAYNDQIVTVEYEALQRILASWDANFGASPEQLQQMLVDQRNLVTDARARLAAIPPWEQDTSLRDAAAASFAWYERKLQAELPELAALYAKQEVTDADLARAEEIARMMRFESDAIDADVRDTQRQFAARFELTLVEPTETPTPKRRTFTAPGVPPQGSALDGAAHASFASRYHNRIVRAQVRVMAATNAFLDATAGEPEPLEAARASALGAVRQELEAARALEPWQGDATLRDALVAIAQAHADLLSKEAAEYAALAAKKHASNADIERQNALAAELNAELVRSLEAFAAAQAAFDARWAVSAVIRWQQEQATR